MADWSIFDPSSLALFKIGQSWSTRHTLDDSLADENTDLDSSFDDDDDDDDDSVWDGHNDSVRSLNLSMISDTSDEDDHDDMDSIVDKSDERVALKNFKSFIKRQNELNGQFDQSASRKALFGKAGFRFLNGNEMEMEDENREDGSILARTPAQNQADRNSTGARLSIPDSRSSLNSDSLAFTLVYCSVFTLTLFYIAFKLTRKWRKQNRERELGNTDHSTASHCGHVACQEARLSDTTTLPYVGLGAIWIPEILNLPTAGSGVSSDRVHNTGQCDNRCDNCQQLSRPPPSYAKLFLDDSPPTYGDALVLLEGSCAKGGGGESYCDDLRASSLMLTASTSTPLLADHPDDPSAPLTTSDLGQQSTSCEELSSRTDVETKLT